MKSQPRTKHTRETKRTHSPRRRNRTQEGRKQAKGHLYCRRWLMRHATVVRWARCQVTDQLDRARERAFGDLRDHRRPPMRHLVAHGWTLPPRRTTAHRRQWARWQRMRAAVQQSPWPRVQARERAARSRHEARERAHVDARAAADAQHWAEWHEALDRGGRRLSVSYFTVPPRAHSVSGCVLPSFSQYPASASRYSGAAAARSP